MTNGPKVSVVLPTYQRAAFLPATLDSLEAQNYNDAYEIIVVDDGSSDSTSEVLSGRTGRLRWERIDHQGLPAPINRALQMASGEYVLLCNDHDLYGPELLQSLAGALDRHPAASFAVSDVVLIDPKTESEIASYPLPYGGYVDGATFRSKTLLPGSGSIASCNMWRASASGGKLLDPAYGASSNVEFWLWLCGRGGVVHVPSVLARVRARDEASEFHFRNHEIVHKALDAKQAYRVAGQDSTRVRHLRSGWRRGADRAAAASLLLNLEKSRKAEYGAIRELVRCHGSTTARAAIEILTRLPQPLARALLRRAAGRSKAAA